MKLEHIGIAVDDAGNAARLFETLLGAGPYKAETVAREGVRTHFIAAGTAKLELLEALGPESPVAHYLEKRGPGLHHLAFEVADIEAQLRRLRDAGFTPLYDEPRPGADGKRIFFLHPKETQGILVEFCQSVPTPFDATEIPWAEGHLVIYERGAPTNPALLVLTAEPVLPAHEALLRRLEMQFHVLAVAAMEADAALAVLDAFAVGQVHLLGLGAGVDAALDLARTHPEHAGRLVLAGLPEGAPSTEHATLVVADDQNDAAALARLRAAPEVAVAVLPGDVLDLDVFVPLLRRHLAG